MKIRVINKSRHKLPAYSTLLSAGMDHRADTDEEIVLKPLWSAVVKTGLFLEIPVGYEAQIRARSGLAINKGITILNSPGTIDADYRGEVCIIMVNLSEESYVIKDGERICQMIIAKQEKAEWVSVDNLVDTTREAGGLGYT